MFPIQWFPGHMKKTLEEIKLNIKFIDIVLVILDARIPISSMNFELLKILNNKPFLVLLNKISLTDLSKNFLFENFFKSKKINTLLIDAKNRINIDKILVKIKKMLNIKINSHKNYKKQIKIMIVGVPNVGKSTLLNSLTKRKVVRTSNKPGITKKLQWISSFIDNIKFLDTPGILYPKINSYKISYSLALCGCIKEELVSKEDLIHYFLDYLKKYYLEKLMIFFNLSQSEINEKNLFQILIKKRYNNEKFIEKNYYDFVDRNNIVSKFFSEIIGKKIQKINFDLDLFS
ncbi:ribosome biogenesis GTPase YlqF ['Cynodon dactylon' phytoplasma]|uniref:ribosome biogenesis GTPase YlqF n=1 Tax='Cynodon dactylon' phytoplasma TaxID=295320 RepID=UPI001265D527|nr:ribosome biogenesis GTPase YlqF ['Cynodon dactylon' phytoplasma]KAB8121937.1 ribosome biogenesis GTPase YlqF ['Cynodon dactylon' phytoplasma]